MKNKKYPTGGTVLKYHTGGTVPQFNIKTVETGKIDTLIQLHELSLSWLGRGTPINPQGSN